MLDKLFKAPHLNLKEKIYIMIFTLAALASAGSVIIHALLGTFTYASTLAISGGLFYTGLAFWLYLKPAQVTLIEKIFTVQAVLFIASFLILSLYLMPALRPTYLVIATTCIWLPCLFSLFFLVYSHRRALEFSIMTLVGLILILFPYAYMNRGGEHVFDGFNLPIQLVAANGVLTLILYFFSTFQRRLRDAEARAQTMATLAYTDSLTGIANRRQLEKRINEEIIRAERYNRQFSVLLFDIDDFKKFNDQYGHLVGDDVLKDLVTCVNANTRATDLFGRWGGEEFLIFSPETSMTSVMTLGKNIRYALRNHKLASTYQVTLSMGVATYQPGDSLESLLKRADAALYLAKASGKDCAVDETQLLKLSPVTTQFG